MFVRLCLLNLNGRCGGVFDCNALFLWRTVVIMSEKAGAKNMEWRMNFLKRLDFVLRNYKIGSLKLGKHLRQPENGLRFVVNSRLTLTMRLMPTGHLLFFASPKCEPAFIIHTIAFAP